MIRVTPDTNILVSATIARGNEFEIIKSAYESRITLVLSPVILQEFMEVLQRPKFRLSSDEIAEAVKRIMSLSFLVIPAAFAPVILTDPDDDMVLATAIAGAADYIVSGDSHLLSLQSYRGIKIVTSKQFLGLL